MATSRRNFIKAGALAAVAAPIPALAADNSNANIKNGELQEPKRKVNITEETDVIDCGGGPAGVSAALAAARSGARISLIELQGCLGGVWTAGLLCNLIDYHKSRAL